MEDYEFYCWCGLRCNVVYRREEAQKGKRHSPAVTHCPHCNKSYALRPGPILGIDWKWSQRVEQISVKNIRPSYETPEKRRYHDTLFEINAEYDNLNEQLQRTTDLRERTAIIKHMHQLQQRVQAMQRESFEKTARKFKKRRARKARGEKPSDS